MGQAVSTRRARLAEIAAEIPVVLSAYDQMQWTGDMAAPFLQEANFLWLTNIKVAGWWLVMTKTTNYLVAPDVDATHQLFDGSLSSDKAQLISGIDQVLTHTEGEHLLHELAASYDTVYTLGDDPHAAYYDFSLNPAPRAMKRKLEKMFTKVEDCRPLLTKLRAIKDDNELLAIREALKVTADAFRDVKKQLSSLTHEYQLEAEFHRAFRTTGAEGHAYAPIVAGGANACTLHYVDNNDPLPKNGMVLLDIGARYNGYAADITRTYAVGKPTERQAAVHAAVEKAHHEIIAIVKPGLALKEYSDQVDVIMKKALIGLGLMKSLDDTKAYRTYFPHAISHGLGLDVHESFGGYKELRPGMVLTVEPGIYIPEEGIGVRIEDDILVTETGYENLSAALPTGL